MTIKGRVIDVSTRTALPGASVSLIDAAGKFLGQGVAADSDGSFGLVSSRIDGNLVFVTSTGYLGLVVDPSLLTGNTRADIALKPNYQEQPDVVVTASRKKSYTWLWLLGLTGVSAIAASRRVPGGRKTIGDTGGTDFSKYIIPIGVVVGGGYVAMQILDKIGLGGPTAEEKAQAAAAEKARQEQIKAAQAIENTAGTYPNATLKTIAAQIAAATSGHFYDYKNLIGAIAYFSGFRHVDAVKFLGYFSDMNGYSLKGWWNDKIKGSVNIADADVLFQARAYAANFKTMGITDLGLWSAEPDQVLLTAITYVYKVANVAVQ
jgi:hypothetical protein